MDNMDRRRPRRHPCFNTRMARKLRRRMPARAPAVHISAPLSAVACLVFALAACAPEAPPAPAEPASTAPAAEPAQRQVDYRVTTFPHVPQQRFLIELVSLSDRELCFSADRWPTAEGLRGQSRTPRVEGEMHRLAPGATRNGFLRFDQFNPVALEGHSARYIDIDPEPVFCESGATP